MIVLTLKKQACPKPSIGRKIAKVSIHETHVDRSRAYGLQSAEVWADGGVACNIGLIGVQFGDVMVFSWREI